MLNLRAQFRALRGAMTFLTRLPVGGYPFSADELRRSSGYFPAVGCALGAMQAVLHTGLGWLLGPWSAALGTVAFAVWITGAFHEDGLADTADALGGGYTKSRVLEILKDSRVGTFGAAALCLSLLARVLALAAAGPTAPAALIVIEAVSRAPPVIMLALIPYATRPEVAKSKDIAEGQFAQAAQAALTAAIVLIAAVVGGALGPLVGCLLVGLAWVIASVAGRVFVRAVGGLTGDFLGAVQQLVALAMWIVWVRP